VVSITGVYLCGGSNARDVIRMAIKVLDEVEGSFLHGSPRPNLPHSENPEAVLRPCSRCFVITAEQLQVPGFSSPQQRKHAFFLGPNLVIAKSELSIGERNRRSEIRSPTKGTAVFLFDNLATFDITSFKIAEILRQSSEVCSYIGS
jgi:hypothetical protein